MALKSLFTPSPDTLLSLGRVSLNHRVKNLGPEDEALVITIRDLFPWNLVLGICIFRHKTPR